MDRENMISFLGHVTAAFWFRRVQDIELYFGSF